MRTVKIGVAGLGRLGYEHARNIVERVPGAVLAAVCDADNARVQQVCKTWDVPQGYMDFADLCADPSLDAVVIASSAVLHAGQIMDALSAGKHVFCEKPLGMTVLQCRQVEAAVEACNGQIFFPGFMHRYENAYLAAKEKIDRGEIGQVLLIRSCTWKDTGGEFSLPAVCSGEPFLDLCACDIDLLRWLSQSEPENIWGMSNKAEWEVGRKIETEDAAAVAVQCENGVMAFLYAGQGSQSCMAETEIIGSKGSLRIGAFSSEMPLEVTGENGLVSHMCPRDFLHRWHDAFVAEMCEFVDCILQNRKPEITASDAAAVSEIACRCRESLECGEMLPLRD